MNSSVRITTIQEIQSAFHVLGALQLTAYLWPQQAYVKDGDKFDFIIIGAGSAGAVIANRLTEIPEVNVLLIEAGGDPPIESEIPCLFSYMKNSSVDWKYPSFKDYSNQCQASGKKMITRGKMLGGSSSINFMAYGRGNYHDYNTWAEMTNDDTWNWDNVLTYFIKSERQEDTRTLDSPYGIYHGTDGLLGVSKIKSDENRIFLESFAELGHKLSHDVSGANPLGYMKTFFTISGESRQSSARCFLTTAKKRTNLHVLKQTMATKILFDDYLNAIGVEVIDNNNTTLKLFAEKEVIVSAGAIGTPQLLMLSGIGPKHHLESKDIELKVNLPVGQQFQDHVMAIVLLTLDKSNPNPEALNPGDLPGNLFEGYATLDKTFKVPQYQTTNFVFNENSMIFDLLAFYHDVKQEVVDELFNKSIGRQILLSNVVNLYPKAHGSIHIKSNDIKDDPDIRGCYYTDNCDLDMHAAFVKDFLQIKETKYFKSVKSEWLVPEFCGCSEFENGCEEFYKCYVTCMSVSGYHHSGSCGMGRVVDSRLRVYGTKKLRVVDASVMPKIIGGNINAPTIMIAEKAADFIKNYYY